MRRFLSRKPKRCALIWRPGIEILEDRVVPSGWLVANTSNNATTSGSLPWAVAQADADTSNARITFSPTAFPSATTITLASTLNLTNTAHSITIDGSGAGPITVGGNSAVEVFNINSNVSATINNLTVANGHTSNSGGGINNAGTVTLTNDVLTANYSGTDGGGLYNSGTASLTNVTLSNNTCYGGAALGNVGTMSVMNSTVSGNTAGYGTLETHNGSTTVVGCTFTGNTASVNGGAVWLSTSGAVTVVTMIDCTINGNSSQYGGGAIATNNLSNLFLNLVNCTITGNSAVQQSPGGIFLFSSDATAVLDNTIVANNVQGSSTSDISGAVSGSGNFIGNGAGMTGIANNNNGNHVGTASSPINPLLNSLGSNGGPTQTMSEQTGSTAIGAGVAVTTISSAVANTTTTAVSVANLSLLAASSLSMLSSGSYFTIQIGSEQMAVVGATGSTLTVVRGVNGTVAAVHGSGASVYVVSDQRAYLIPSNSPPVADIGAYQSTGVNKRPTITTVNPNAGGLGGGTTVTITGANFTGATAVSFGGTAATSFTVNSNTQITAVDPAETSGTVDITVTAPLGTSVQSASDQFTYVAATTTTLTDNGPNASDANQAVSFGVQVSGGAPTGLVQLEDISNSSAVVASGTLVAANGGAITFTVPAGVLLAGSHNLVAVYAGDSNYVGSTSTSVLQQVNPAPSITTMALPNATYGQAYSQTLTETGGTSAFTYTVTIGVLPAGLSLNASTGAITGTPSSVSGSPFGFTVTLTDAAGATASQNLTITVNQATTATTMGTSQIGPFSLATLFTFTATIGSTPVTTVGAGTVTFYEGPGLTKPIGSPVNVNGGSAVSVATALPPGSDTVTAVYSGATNYAGSQGTTTVNVIGVSTTTTLTDNGPNPSNSGQVVNFTGSVSGGVPTGDTVTLEDASNGNAVLAITSTQSGGSFAFNVSNLSVGVHNLFAVFAGDTTDATSSSTQVTQVVNNSSAPPTVASIVVNGDAGDNLAATHSRVATLYVTFSAPVQLGSGAFTLALHNNVTINGTTGQEVGTLPPTLNWSSSDDIHWIVTFAGTSGLNVNVGADGHVTIKDGVYDLTVAANQVHPYGVLGVNMASNFTQTFWALFGDTGFCDSITSGTIGDGNTRVAVGNGDFNEFANAYQATGYNVYHGYLPGLDVDGDGSIGNVDFNAFANNYQTCWTF